MSDWPSGPGQSGDPFMAERERHGWKMPRDPNLLRDLAREEDCDRCRELIEQFDRAFMGAFMAGTGPFA